MKKSKTILLIGGCGSGKTWVMKELLSNLELTKPYKFNLIRFRADDKYCVLGKYDGTKFEGSDRLSMAVAKDFEMFKKLTDKKDWTVICEGDRFTNSKFIEVFKPYIIKIKDDGKEGRLKRKSNQSERQIRTIQTRVNNIKNDLEVKDSNEALKTILNILL